MKTVLDEFGERLIRNARDVPIRQFDATVSGHMKDAESKQLYQELSVLPPKQLELVRKIFIRAVDETLHHVLRTFEQNKDLDIVTTSSDGTKVSLTDKSDGLSGELYTED